MAYTEAFLKHAKGMLDFVAWLSELERKKDSFKIEGDNVIALNIQPSLLFSIGVPHSRSFGKYPFLLFQPREKKWAKDIQWAHVILKPKKRRLYLVSQRVNGDGLEIPDIPAYAISIQFDVPEKLIILGKSPFIEARGIWQDEDDGELKIENGPSLWKVKMVIDDTENSLFQGIETGGVRTANSLWEERMGGVDKWPTDKKGEKGKYQAKHTIQAPEYQGEAVEVDAGFKDTYFTDVGKRKSDVEDKKKNSKGRK